MVPAATVTLSGSSTGERRIRSGWSARERSPWPPSIRFEERGRRSDAAATLSGQATRGLPSIYGIARRESRDFQRSTCSESDEPGERIECNGGTIRQTTKWLRKRGHSHGGWFS